MAPNAFNAPIFRGGVQDKKRYKNGQRKRSTFAQAGDYDNDLAYLELRKKKKQLVSKVPSNFIVETFRCLLQGKKTRFAQGVKARTHKVNITVRTLRAQAPQLHPPPPQFHHYGMEWSATEHPVQSFVCAGSQP